ncbi:FxsA family protein [Nocardiopsis sp. LOL_012]|uniref:FxsA family protein n=1 Tax=Nocardiopsis sp. LOL_012 TaxID=3345409 RepID=UPI003A886E34
MALLVLLALMALPFVEVWLMIVVGGWIGVPWTIAALVSLTVLGGGVLRRAGTKAFRDADEAMRSGEPPRGGLLDPLMVMVGGLLLVVPGFLTALLGVLMVLPFTRPALRWAFSGWTRRRMSRMQERMDRRFTPPEGGVPGQGGPFGPRPGGGSGGGADSAGPSRGRVIQGHFEPVDDDGR